MFWPCETRTSTCRSFATISSGLYRFLAIAVLLDVKDIPQVGPLQWGWISPSVLAYILVCLTRFRGRDEKGSPSRSCCAVPGNRDSARANVRNAGYRTFPRLQRPNGIGL